MAHEGLWEQLDKLDRLATAKNAKCQYLDDPPRYIVTLLNADYGVNLSAREIFSVRAGSPAEFLEQLCVLAYLINAKDLPFADKLARPETLPGGQFFFKGLHSLPTEKLERAFGQCPERLYQAVERFNARRCEFGDASIELYVLPRIALTMVIWASDEEFDARASILFDRTTGSHLPLDALLAAVNLAVDAVLESCEQSS